MIFCHICVAFLSGGLVKVTSEFDGFTTWVKDDENVISRFHKDGRSCIIVKDVLFIFID